MSTRLPPYAGITDTEQQLWAASVELLNRERAYARLIVEVASSMLLTARALQLDDTKARHAYARLLSALATLGGL